jgi:saccharopine dehydrogenase-like NADP-dependent oxidoreductase
MPYIFRLKAETVKGKKIKVKGVIPPEGLEPKPFLAELAKAGTTFKETVTSEIVSV